MYPPEYIELRVTETSGTLHGRYRARYRIPDQAISPAVDFAFEGPAQEEEVVLPWSGPGGARGEITLHIAAGETLDVSWVAHRIGAELALVSGKATLIRREE